MLNHIAVIGRLTNDPELHSTPAGVPVANYTLAVDRDNKNSDGQRMADFIDITSWRAQAEYVERNFHKGDMLAVSGRLQSRKWKDRDGNNRTSWGIEAEDVYPVRTARREEAEAPAAEEGEE